MAQISMLTTIDNPYNPFDNYEEWFAFDYSHGYNSTGLLARLAVVSEDNSEADQDKAIDDAIEEIVIINASGMHMRVFREIPSDYYDVKLEGE